MSEDILDMLNNIMGGKATKDDMPVDKRCLRTIEELKKKIDAKESK